ncbi:hypothetical protein GCM10009604_04100 [Corynebacterium aurimucosum]|uniref:hypothetical protein n=1 Tax=Corynebacterium aurimucosum TaxID=169292 RepID=UPI0019203A31|nr:hypothetical protein [Corynebacterium aurimucosum]QQU96657.1 hypothetical protein I6I66_06205 [Corynebacterium aurimucosum]UTA70491.1 hypothetical protein J3S22_06660 [Corynebacterium aurimucosum]WJY71031.1 hypothetical protein CAURIM_09665 [Corynebacterium aurimucosum]
MTNPFSCIANDTARYFTHQGISCMTQLGPFTINGYIELPENHPWLDFPDTLEVHPDIEVHGGITYHEGRVIGFDTNHLGDGQHPDAPNAYPSHFTGHTWTWEEVEAETRKLADQAKDTHTMPQPTRQEIIDAYETLDMLLGFSEDRNPDLVPERRRIIEKALPPRPQPTMADVEWDDDLHYLAEATHPVYETVLMLGQHKDGTIKFFALNRADSKTVWGQPEYLTLTGKRYTLTEVQE